MERGLEDTSRQEPAGLFPADKRNKSFIIGKSTNDFLSTIIAMHKIRKRPFDGERWMPTCGTTKCRHRRPHNISAAKALIQKQNNIIVRIVSSSTQLGKVRQ